MAVTLNLTALQPPARYDGVEWTEALIYEAAAPTGPWSLIDTQAMAPDVDAAEPQVRNFTTKHATLDQGWYQVVFRDGAGNTSPPTDPIRVTSAAAALPPDPESVRSNSPLLRTRLPDPSDPQTILDLRTVVYQATATVQALTWRIIDPTLGCAAPEEYVCELVPPALVPVAVQAITRVAERIFVLTEADFAEQLATGRRLRGFSAGPYSEQYFAPGEFARRGAVVSRPQVDPDDAVDQALWALMTEDARDYFVWRASGVAPPVGVAIAYDYRRQSSGYEAGSLGGWGGRSGPDGL